MQLPYFSAFESVPDQYRQRLMPEAMPQYLQSALSPQGIIICLHGFTGMPYEVLPVAKACVASGFDAAVPLLPGHGYAALTDQRQWFPRITMEQMHEVARAEIERARQQYEFVGMFGLSMGGAIALTMASEGRLDACVAAAPALRLPDIAERLIPILGWANFFIRKRKKPEFYLPCYPFYNSWALRELRRMGRYATDQLPKVTCPLCVVHSHQDPTISPAVVDMILQHVPQSVDVEWFDESGHCLPCDIQGQAMAEYSARFFQQIAGCNQEIRPEHLIQPGDT
ncbi:MAG: alpha/beta fold hydrolase [Synechococcales cyanobacterium T60_A2020_003]|nr:alpha/beta fold hydrolase [Synechococcales cyanobacterium T60_A2020_003]